MTTDGSDGSLDALPALQSPASGADYASLCNSPELPALPGNPDDLFDTALARSRECHRRRALLGDICDVGDGVAIRHLSRQIGYLPYRVLWNWYHVRQRGGDAALEPVEWTPLTESERYRAIDALAGLGPLVRLRILPRTAITARAAQVKYSARQLERLALAYRSGGVWGLAHHGPGAGRYPPRESSTFPPGATGKAGPPSTAERALMPPSLMATSALAYLLPVSASDLQDGAARVARLPCDPGSLDEAALDTMAKRLTALGPLTTQMTVTRGDVETRAAVAQVTPRTIWTWLARYRSFGFLGLAPQRRTDTGTVKNICGRTVQLVVSIYLAEPNWSYTAIQEETVRLARSQGELPPTLSQVRRILERLPPGLKLLADGQRDTFRNVARFTRPIDHDPLDLILQVDPKAPLDIWVIDDRPRSERDPSGVLRPYLVPAILAAPRGVAGAIFTYTAPTRYDIAAVLRQALLPSAYSPFYGMVYSVWVDRGAELIARFIRQLCAGLGIDLYIGPPRYPELRGIIERWHRTSNQRFFSRQPGFIGTARRGRSEPIRAELTLGELEKRFWEWIVERYHSHPHGALRMTPLQYWERYCSPTPLDKRQTRLLDVLLLEPVLRVVGKEGIEFRTRLYWHSELSYLVGITVTVRAAQSATAPDEIQVYVGGTWHCRAVAADSAEGKLTARQEVAAAQLLQRTVWNGLWAALMPRLESARADAAAPVEASAMPEPALESSGSLEVPATPQGAASTKRTQAPRASRTLRTPRTPRTPETSGRPRTPRDAKKPQTVVEGTAVLGPARPAPPPMYPSRPPARHDLLDRLIDLTTESGRRRGGTL